MRRKRHEPTGPRLNLLLARKGTGISRRALAGMVHVSAGTLAKMERGESAGKPATWALLSAALGISQDVLMSADPPGGWSHPSPDPGEGQ